MKNGDGITLISVVVTVVVLLILSSVVIVNVDSGQDMGDLNNMYADLSLLEEKTIIYFNKYNTIPKKDIVYTKEEVIEKIGVDTLNVNDGDVYYELDKSELGSITTFYGNKGNNDQDDTYIINGKTLTVYYLKGIKVEDTYYYTYPRNYSNLLDYQYPPES